jgi:hypothetical protein
MFAYSQQLFLDEHAFKWQHIRKKENSTILHSIALCFDFLENRLTRAESNIKINHRRIQFIEEEYFFIYF